MTCYALACVCGWRGPGGAIAVEMLGAARSVPWMTLSGMRDGVDVVGDREGVDQVGRTGRLALSAGRERLTFDATEPRRSLLAG